MNFALVKICDFELASCKFSVYALATQCLDFALCVLIDGLADKYSDWVVTTGVRKPRVRIEAEFYASITNWSSVL